MNQAKDQVVIAIQGTREAISGLVRKLDSNYCFESNDSWFDGWIVLGFLGAEINVISVDPK